MSEDSSEQKEESDYDGFGPWVCEDYVNGFQDLPPSPRNLFRPEMGIELNEKNYPYMWCVGSVASVSGDFVLTHFDGWRNYWDVWYRWDAPEIRPVGTCQAMGCKVHSPYQGDDAVTWERTGNWDSYLAAKNYVAAPIEAFSKLFVSEVSDRSMIQSLFVLSANKVASVSHCYIGLRQIIGPSLEEKLKQTKVCTVCSTAYLLGYKCVKAFTLQQQLRSPEGRLSQTGSICSLPCLAYFKELYIGNLPQEKCTISLPYQHKSTIDSPFDYLFTKSSRECTISSQQKSDLPSVKNLFRRGMKVEAVDPNYPTMYCPCTILRSSGDEVMINFDGWGHSWDIWLYRYSPLLRSIGTTESLSNTLTNYNVTDGTFDWGKYLKDTNSIAAPPNAFSKLYICEFSTTDAVAPLSVLSINALLKFRDKLKFSHCRRIFPFQINGKPFQVKDCSICKKLYYKGWLAIPAFTIQKYHNSFGTAKLCSSRCLKVFHRNSIGPFV